MSDSNLQSTPFISALISGGIAGIATDISLYPLDTIKTRLQSPHGFLKSGGFRGIYKGLSIAAVGSAPGAALFFSSYETMKQILQSNHSNNIPTPFIHMIAASCGEVAACIIRVPTEVIKQRLQAGMQSNVISTIKQLWYNERHFFGLYKGYNITIMREIPFAFIQFPLYEFTKGRKTYSYEGAICGSLSGAIAAAITTPLDVLKTRLMIGEDSNKVRYRGVIDAFHRILEEGNQKYYDNTNNINTNNSTTTMNQINKTKNIKIGWRIFFSGIQPRVMWIGIGGFVFFGAYEQSINLINPIFTNQY